MGNFLRKFEKKKKKKKNSLCGSEQKLLLPGLHKLQAWLRPCTERAGKRHSTNTKIRACY